LQKFLSGNFDAKEGFCASNSIQTIGRAAGVSDLYADNSPIAWKAIEETERRHQLEYNEKQRITPQPILIYQLTSSS